MNYKYSRENTYISPKHGKSTFLAMVKMEGDKYGFLLRVMAILEVDVS